MRWFFLVVLLGHGLIHGMGFLKAFGLAELPQLTQPISRTLGLIWLAAGVLTVSATVAFVLWPRGAWVLGAAAVVVSQVVIFSAWHDARFGTLANVILLVGVIHGYLTQGPTSFRAEYERAVAVGLARPSTTHIVTEEEVAALPDPVKSYLRNVGVIGKPSVTNYRIRFTGRIRSGADSVWMPFEADQQSFVDPPTRLFWMRATMYGLPVEAFHLLRDGAATMRVKAAGAVTMVDADGPAMDKGETVTLFNDMCILAPATLLSRSIVWESLDSRTAKARFTNGDHTIAATLFFNEQGMLANFISDDRSQSSGDAKTFIPLRFSTPVRDYRMFGPFKIAGHGEAMWHPDEAGFVYGEFEMQNVEYNVQTP